MDETNTIDQVKRKNKKNIQEKSKIKEKNKGQENMISTKTTNKKKES